MLGLSATAYRRDGLTRLIYLTLGDRTHWVDPQRLREIGAVLTPKIIRRETVFQYDYADDYPAMVSTLAENEDRNRQIVNDVIAQVQDQAGTALVVSDRVTHCEALAELVRDAGQGAEVLTGKTPKEGRERIVNAIQAGKVPVLCSTIQLLGEGFDCSGLSSLFLTTPVRFRGRLLQIVGRILRPGTGKRPRVFDYVDVHVGLLQHQAQKRAQALEGVVYGAASI
ncbi:DEAD/DEAH box helicase [Desulfohalobium retbaense]|uniref:DEAD/DEAH box helicase n=1 Tax=Desulfohalobium retbaense TaxID=45663 RepID=UPI00019B48AA|nr:helicase-related protein [Desulfohalobium retbaense]